jgi:hypothetical protein
MLPEARSRQERGEPFAGVIYAHQLRITTGQTVRDLELIAKIYDPCRPRKPGRVFAAVILSDHRGADILVCQVMLVRQRTLSH